MRQRIQKLTTENPSARRAGNLLMIAGVITPILGISVTKFVTLEFDIYRRMIQAIFIAALLLFISGILVKNYWRGRKTDERFGPTRLWPNANPAIPIKQFDWTGVGCSLLVLGPGAFFIVGMLFAKDFEYAPFVGFGIVVLCMIVGSRLYGLGRTSRAKALSEENDANALSADVSIIRNPADNACDRNLPQITPLSVPEGFVLVDASEGVSAGTMVMGAFTALWYGVTLFFLFMVLKFGGENAGIAMLIVSGFLLAGLLPLYLLIRLVRMGRAFERRAELLVPHWPLERGDDVSMFFQCNLKKALTTMSIDAALECQKIDRSGSETQTYTVDKRALSIKDFKQRDMHVTGKWQMSMPTDWTAPYTSEREDLNWIVNVIVELAEGPKGVFSFPVLVVPAVEQADRI